MTNTHHIFCKANVVCDDDVCKFDLKRLKKEQDL